MKKLRKAWIGISLAMLLTIGLAAGLACEQAEDDAGETDERGTLYLVDQDWNGQLVMTAVAQILLEQEMGLDVATKFAPRRFGAVVHRAREWRLPLRLLQLAVIQR